MPSLQIDDVDKREVEMYLTSEGFERVEGGDVGRYVFESGDDLYAEAWVDYGEELVHVQIYDEVPDVVVEAIEQCVPVDLEEELLDEYPFGDVEYGTEVRSGVPTDGSPTMDRYNL